jgi:metallo-beta-lactamase family protein
VPRGRSTPYGAQLDRLLARADELTVFSAATLESHLDHPPHQKRRTSIAGIHKALRMAFAEGKLITFVDADGLVLREREVVVPGSKAVSQPQIFARLGVATPDPNYHPVTHEETIRRGLVDVEVAANGGTATGSPHEPVNDPEQESADATDSGNGRADDSEPLLTLDQALSLLTSYPPGEKSTPPDWVDERLLREWTSLPDVVKRIVGGLDRAVGADKFELIRAGVTRKQRSWRSESTVAGNLAGLARTSGGLWRNVAQAALNHYLDSPDGVPRDTLPALAQNPLEFYENSERPPEAVLLCAMALRVDDSVLELIAADAAGELGELKAATKANAQQERIQTLEAEAVELRRTAKDAEKALKGLRRHEQLLTEENRRLEASQAEAGEAADAARVEADGQLLRRANEAETELEKLEERIPELEAQLEGLEGVRERLETAEGAMHEEERLRAQAEDDAKRHHARVRELSNERSGVEGARNLPVENAAALIDALARPIGEAARHAAERLATGRARPHDDLLLELAASIAQMTGRLDADDAEVEILSPGEAATSEARADAVDETDAPRQADPALLGGEEAAMNNAISSSEPTSTALPDAPSEAPIHVRRRRRSKLKLRPLGGAGEVGGSAILVTNNSGHAVLLDCGQRVRGEYGLESEPQFHRRIGHDGRLHGILLSHAHIDHVGSLPVLHREQSEAQHELIPVYLTEPTRRLAQIMLEDSAKIQQHRELNPAERGFLDYAAGSMEAAYRMADVTRVLDDEFVREVSPGLAVPVPDTSFVVRFLPVAHVLGSCAIHLTDTDNDQTLLYTGDLGPIADPQVTLPQYSLGEMLPADLVLMESTYGAQQPEFTDGRSRRRSLAPREAAIKRLCQYAEHAQNRGGCVLLPAFSLGRTQELAMLIDQARRDGDAPAGEIKVAGMGERITHVYNDYSKGVNAWARAQDMPRVDELGGRMRKTDLSFEDVVAEVLEGEFAYVIASPAMLASGWSRTFLENMVDNPAHAIIMSGYLPRNAGGIPGLHRMHTGETMNIGGRNLRVLAQFDQLRGLSAHPPSIDLFKFAEYMARQGNDVAFGMVHGEQAAQESLAEHTSTLPEVGSAESLHNGQVWQPHRP